ncbi:MAG: hypothetical protein ACM67P_01670, partial [Clostridiales bacterium]
IQTRNFFRRRRRKLRITQNNFCLLFWQKLFIIHYVAPPFKICRTVVRQILYEKQVNDFI